jgi:DNA-binding MarR family transcriptional regulator
MNGMITPLQVDFLRLLTRTGFATNAHIQQMQIGHPTNSKHYLTKRLLDGLYIGRVMMASPYGFGRRTMYYLTKKGAELIAEIDQTPLDEISYTPHKGGIQSAKDRGEVSLIRADFPHKEKYICSFLALEKHLESTDYEIKKYHHYYQLSGDKGTTLNLNGRNFRPDGIWFCESVTGKNPVYAYVVEIHRHSERKKIIKQLRHHVEAFKVGSMAERFGIDHPYFILSIFADENIDSMKSIIAELQTDPDTWAYIEKFFMFATITDVKDNFYNAFGYFGGNKKPIPLLFDFI